MRNDLGCTPAYGNVPSDSRPSLPPSVYVIGEIQEQGKVPPESPWARPPKLSLGWIWALGKTAHFSGTQALPPDPSQGY